MSELTVQPIKYVQHAESVEVVFRYSDLPNAFAQMMCPLAKDVNGKYLSDADMMVAIKGCAPPREWFEMQEGRLSGSEKEVLKTLPSFVQAVAPILMPDNQQDWYEDLIVGEPELIEGQWKRPAKIVDLRDNSNLAKLKSNLLKVVADIRYNHEVGGITISGALVKTDRESQSTITGAYARAQTGEVSVAWKAENGFVDLNNTLISAFGDAVFEHVQACFAHESELAKLIEEAQTWEALFAIDLENGWPNDVYGETQKANKQLPLLETV